MEQVTIERLGHQGDGIAPGPVFVPGTLPGEVVEGEISGGMMAAPKIVTPSETRVKPPCRHAKSCGGCALQHASDDFVAGWKVDVVRKALAAQGIDAAFRPIETSPPRSRRRATFAARRTKKGALVGFHGRASGTIVEIPDCQLLRPELMAALPVAEALALEGASRKGALAVTATVSAAGLDIAVTGGKPLDGPLQLALAQLTEAQGLARLTWEGEVIAMRHPPVQRFGAAQVVPPPGAFLQATEDGEAALLSAAREIVGEARRVVDLFAGCGTFSLPLAERAEVHAVEGAREMTEALDTGWRRAQGLKRVTSEARDLFRRPLMPDELARFDAAVLDPPRAGAEAQVEELAQAQLPVIAYVSCNPVSFARDAARLIAAGYRLNWVQVVDQFRWSPHVELAAGFTLADTDHG
ncbi:class I SAM-dependent RNA methyltransferase [Pseudodonghicola flavimaris]|uniref:Class I SAM-dependent RNA methyltransferase n=1 Tax=Pseudodonghicola flavimaris TaxID=3050036 RepID=A0ABT7EZV0_9RHOB|nr:class I SAM-dependent RNA methyltransferase [Pseudodonghicola flavimaris]MDK3017886.1 class I SAM-dependent RNA methyltransferase [Pseudodonghicola flavimaris]